MPDPFAKYWAGTWTAQISFDDYRRVSRNERAELQNDYSAYRAAFGGQRKRLQKGMPVVAFFCDGSGPVLGRIRSAHPENPLSYVWIEDCGVATTSENPRGVIAFRRDGIFPVSGWHFIV